MAYEDFTPIFRLCWELSQDADLILTRAIPDRDVALSAYLYFLLAQNRVEASEPVAQKASPLSRLEDRTAGILRPSSWSAADPACCGYLECRDSCASVTGEGGVAAKC